MFPIPIALWNTARRVAVTPDAGLLAISGLAPNVFTGRGFFPSVGSLAITGTAPIITVGANNIARTPSAGALAITGTQLQYDIAGDQFIAPNVRALTIIGSAPIVTVTTPLAVFLDGTLTNASSSASIAYTMIHAVPAGSLLVIMAGQRSQNTFVSASDTHGNVYAVDAATFLAGRETAVGIIRSRLTTGLSAGDVVTIATNAASGVGGSAAVVAYVANTAASPLDRAATASGVNTTVTVSTAATTHANDVIIGVANIDPGSGSVLVPLGWSTLFSQLGVQFAGGRNRLGASYKIVAATGVQTYTPPAATTTKWAAGVAAYKGTP